MDKLLKNNLDLNDLFILESYLSEEGRKSIEDLQLPNINYWTISVRHQYLRKEEYLVQDPEDTSRLKLSVRGEALLNYFYSEIIYESPFEEVGRTTSSEHKFEEWWKTYPTTTAWTSQDKKKFIGSRNLKNLTKAKAKVRYLQLLNQGLKHEDLLGGLKYELKLMKEDSIKKNENKLDFFKGMESYFNQERYLTYIDHYRKNPSFVEDEEVKKSKNVTDI